MKRSVLCFLVLASPAFAQGPAASITACAARLELRDFRPLLGEAPDHRVLSYLFDVHNRSAESLMVQPSFSPPWAREGASSLVFGMPMMLRPDARAVLALPLEATVMAAERGLDIAAVSRATGVSCRMG